MNKASALKRKLYFLDEYCIFPLGGFIHVDMHTISPRMICIYLSDRFTSPSGSNEKEHTELQLMNCIVFVFVVISMKL